MAPHTRSQGKSATSDNARGKEVIGKTQGAQAQSKVTKSQGKNSKSRITTWVGKQDEDDGIHIRSSTKDRKGGAGKRSRRLSKTQRVLTTYIKTSKATTKTADKEDAHKHEIPEVIRETVYTEHWAVTSVRQEISDTTNTTATEAEASKKRKRDGEDDDYYIPSTSATKIRALPGDEEEVDAEKSVIRRPRRQARNLILSYAELPAEELSGDIEAKPSSGNPTAEKSARTRENELGFTEDIVQSDDTTTAFLTLKHAQPEEDEQSSLVQATTVNTAAHIEVKEPIDTGSSVQVKTEIKVLAQTSKPKRIPIKKPQDGWDNKQYSFKFGWSPYPDFKGPTPDEATKVFEMLRADLATRGITVGPGEKGLVSERPAHGSANGVTVDAIVRTILSQATSNDNALFVQDLLIKKFTYTVDGEQVKGQVPNYHSIRCCAEKDLAEIIQPGGIHNKRAQFIKGLLDGVYKANTADNPSWDGVETGNTPNAPDFEPGLLSLQFLEGKSKLDIFNWLLSVKGVGVKTAHCVLEFNYGFEVCAVDTHVHVMAAALQWLPRDCMDADKAAMHLDAHLPGHLKHDLHQAFWNHRQHCAPCKRAGGDKVKKADAVKCVLEKMLCRRDVRRRPVVKSVVVKKEKEVKVERKPSTVPFEKLTTEKAAELGYEYHETAINDDFAAGSVNVRVKKRWVLKE